MSRNANVFALRRSFLIGKGKEHLLALNSNEVVAHFDENRQKIHLCIIATRRKTDEILLFLILNLISVAVKGHILIGLNENMSILINFKVKMTFEDNLVSNLSRWD